MKRIMNRHVNIDEGGIAMSSTAAPSRKVHRKSLGRRMADNWQPYVLLLIPVVITIIYKYGPMYGI